MKCKLYYDGRTYQCDWESKIIKNMWYSMEPVKMKVRMQNSVYEKILYDIKVDDENRTLHDKFNFHIIESYPIKMFKIESYLEKSIISSKLRKGEIIVAFKIYIIKKDIMNKDYVRDIILSELV